MSLAQRGLSPQHPNRKTTHVIEDGHEQGDEDTKSDHKESQCDLSGDAAGQT